jgi:primosomal protein DnaI
MRKLTFESQNINTDEIIEKLTEDEKIRQFFIKHDLDTDTIEQNLLTLLTYQNEYHRCDECKGLPHCRQDALGFQPVLRFEEGKVKSFYQRCPFAIQYVNQATTLSRIDALYMPQMIKQASLDDFDFTRSDYRKTVYQQLTQFITKYTRGEQVKGLYLTGPYQSGKTYCLAALANELASRGMKSLIAYYPDLVREVKSRINDNTVEELISKLKQAPVLMLDDIGGESPSVWVRDEVLGPILQYRLLDGKPTFFSSNLTQKQLTNLFITNNQTAEKMKAARIEARIKSLSDEIRV